MKALQLNPEQIARTGELLCQMHYMVPVNPQLARVLFWGDADWYVVLECMIAAGMIRKEERMPYAAFCAFIEQNEFELRKQKLSTRQMSRVAAELQGTYPWPSAAKDGPNANCVPRWRELYRWLLPQLQLIMS